MLLAKYIWFGFFYWLMPVLPAQTYQTTLVEGSSFTLKGSSNINKFELVYTGDLGKTNKVQVEREDSKMNMKSGSGVNLKVGDFKSSNAYITKDFRKMLRADTYPNLVIEPVSVWKPKAQATIVCVLVNLTIAGCTRQETISLDLTKQDATALQCKGSHKISLKRYALAAPKKALGAVQVHDEVAIDMLLKLQYRKIK
ncbi:YceI family protein [Niabella yanshanensis]|uniref:YceI family protein n=1 Tax=Niabella yanshanensis TaxID=577386 RepID=A0ABZ0VZF4_9BACT|nr:YceI family protein [Niabella yanshanensis]WQD36410.1 YceI family protein [Niabella yanshanensis]